MNKSVFITGAASGTGFAIAKRFASEGYDVFIGSRSEENAQEAANKIAEEYGVFSKGYKTIVFDENNVREIFDDIKNNGYCLDCLVLNAANLGIGQNIFTVDMKDFMNVYETNIGWNFMMVRQAALQMREKGNGSVVFISSNTAYRAIADRTAYSSSKSGILGMARALAFDLGKYGIRVNCVLPGMIKTERWSKNLNGIQDIMTNCTPIGDIADFEDIANAAYFLGSDGAKNVTGAELTVDGGNTIQLVPDLSRKKSR